MTRFRIGLPFLWVVLAFQVSAVRLSPAPQPVLNSKQQARTGCPIAGGLPLPISPGRLTECELKLGDHHNYLISLKPGDLFRARVDQRGVDAVVTLLGPDGEVLLRMDSLNGTQGEEPVLALASRPGQHTLRVSGGAAGLKGSYRLSIEEPRSPSSAERVQVDALRKMTQGGQLSSEKPALALQKLREALQALESIQDAQGQIQVLERIAVVLSDQRAYSEALARCREGIALAQEAGDTLAEARFLNLAGLTHRSLKDLESAQKDFERALDLFERERDLCGQALALNNLGLITDDRGRFQEALDHYMASLAFWERTNEPGQHANTLSNLGELYLSLGEPSKALEQFNKAFLLLNQANRRDLQYAVLNGAGLALRDMKQIPKALWSYGRALRFADRPEQKALTLHRLGLLYRDEKDWRKASAAFSEAIRLARSISDTRLEAYALADMAAVHHRQGSMTEALRKFDIAGTLFEKLDIPIYVASSLFGRAEVERDLGRLEEAVASVKRSIDILEDLRADVVEPDQRAFFFASRHRFYDLYLELLMQLRRPELAFEAMENARARTQLDDMAGRGGPATKAMSLEEIQGGLLDRDSLLLAYSLGPSRSHLWAVSQEKVESFPLPRREIVEELALRVWRGLSRKGGKPEIPELSRMLLPPGLHLSSGTRLIVIPDGALHLIPFAALQAADGRRLLFDHTIVYEPSASVLVGMRRKLRKRPPAPKTIAVLADPVFRQDDSRISGGRPPSPRAGGESRNQIAGLRRLDFTRAEAAVIRKLVPKDEDRFEALDFHANRTVALGPDLGFYRMLHFGTHHQSGLSPERNGLVLSLFDRRGRPIEGLLRATEVYNLKLPVELVVLSACGTGLAEEVRGEGPMGLPRAFFHAGARRVVVSLWDVDDASTAELMQDFYSSMLHDKLPPAEALRSAQAAMAATSRRSDPRYWAPFIILGEPD